MKFTEFPLHQDLLKGIENAGYVDCTSVQEQVLQVCQEGRDLYVQSQTGTGKTAAYLVSVIQELLSRQEVTGKKALIMVPTRELAVQVQEEAVRLTKFTKFKCASFFGGVGYDKQIQALKQGVDILIGTPGRIIDLQEGNQMKLDDVAFLVLDEADRMFDMGFYPDLRRLLKVLPIAEKRQTMLFSATLNSYVKNLAWEYTRNPAEITIDAENITVDEIDQELLHVSSDDKLKLLLGIINAEKPESLIIFCNTKRTCEVVSKRLTLNGIESQFLIGDLPQKIRQRIMNSFKAGTIKCLVATDVAARGIDVNDLAMVINYDIPNEAENYVHRIGRTARAGKSGKAYTFCSEQDVYSLPAIERYIEKNIPANVADSSLFIEDKSAGVYIKTDSYHESYQDKSEFGRMRAKEHQKKVSGDKKHSSSKNSRGKGRYSERNNEAKKEYKRDRRVFNAEEEAMLATLSTDERMKLYKERFAGKDNFASKEKTSSYSKNKNKSSKAKTFTENASSKKSVKGKKKPYNNRKNNNRKAQETMKTKNQVANKNSLFTKIKSFFGHK